MHQVIFLFVICSTAQGVWIPPAMIVANQTHLWLPEQNLFERITTEPPHKEISVQRFSEAIKTTTTIVPSGRSELILESGFKHLTQACTAPIPLDEIERRNGMGRSSRQMRFSSYDGTTTIMRQRSSTRWKSDAPPSQQWPDTNQPWNFGILFVPQQQAWIIERMGRFDRILKPGLNFAIPIIDKVEYVRSLKEFAIDIPTQHAVSKDNVVLVLDAILYLRIVDPISASYGVHDPEFAVTQLAQTTMRSELGKITLDTVFHERERLNIRIVNSMNNATAAWGICCLRYEIRDIQLPVKIQAAMEMEVEAERKKRAQILTSQGTREAEINVSEGKKISRILASEAEKQEKINQAAGNAEAVLLESEARAKSLEAIGKALSGEHGNNAASLMVAQEYVQAFKGMAKSSTTMLLPKDASNISGMVSQAMTIYKTLSTTSE